MSKFNFKEFGPTSWSIDNKTSIYILSIFISIAGIFSYNALPKEQFPDIVIPTIIVQTVYPGSSPKDIENLITKPLEKKNQVGKWRKKTEKQFNSGFQHYHCGV